MKVAPQVIFYDFACSLQEYCFNRESSYFGNTKFYFYIFQGFSHLCSPAYNSKFLSGVRGVATSVCEQFNSYLQCIKASAEDMSPVNFVFRSVYDSYLEQVKEKIFREETCLCCSYRLSNICYYEDCLTKMIVHIFLAENFVLRQITTTLE